MTYALITPPGEPPISVDDARRHLRIAHDDDNDYIAALIEAATNHLQQVAGLCLVTQGHRLYLDGLTGDGWLALQWAPLVQLDAVTAYDAAGNAVSLDPSQVIVRRGGDRVRLCLPAAWKGLCPNGLELDFTAGFGSAADVPASLRQALLLHVAYMHGWRGVLSPDQQPVGLPDGYSRLVAPYLAARL